jgi:hypothetical protein
VDTLHAEMHALIGQADGAAEHLFGQVVGVAVDEAGVIYVADAFGSSVRAYDASGAYLSTVGSEGDGPGEFRYLLGLDLDPDGHLLVRGAPRISVFARGPTGAVTDSLVRTLPVEPGLADRSVRGKAVGRGYFAPSYYWEGFQRRGYFYLAHDSVGRITDTVFVPPFADPETTGVANYPVNDQGFGVNVDGINRAPFEPRPSWDVDRRGRVVFAPGDRYEIVQVGPRGDTVWSVRRSVAAREIPVPERRDSAAEFNARLDSVPVSIDDVRGMSAMARRRELPATLPAIIGIQVAEDGDLWVRRWPGTGTDETVFDVLDPTGTLLHAVRVPAALRSVPAPWIAGDLVVGVIVDPTTGVEQVGVFRLAG